MTRPQVGDIIRFGEYGTAQASDVLSGKTIGTEDGLVDGTMTNNGVKTITPSSSEQALSGFYASGSKVVGDADLVAANILTGKNVFGVVGTAKSFASGNYTITSSQLDFYNFNNTKGQYQYVNVTGLNFKPTIIVVYHYIPNPPFTKSGYVPVVSVFDCGYEFNGHVLITDTSLSTNDPNYFRLKGNAVIGADYFRLPIFYVDSNYTDYFWVAQG